MPSVPLIRARPSLATSVSGAMRVGSGPGVGGVVGHLALAEQRERAVGQRREIARGAQRSVLADDGRDARVEQREDRFGDDRPRPRATHGQRAGAQQHHRAHDLALDGRPHPGGM
jgi:hypothetical protein